MNKLPNSTGQFGLDHSKQFYNQSNKSKSSFSFQHLTEDFVHKTLLSVKSNKASGLHLIPARFLKDGAKLITAPLIHIIQDHSNTQNTKQNRSRELSSSFHSQYCQYNFSRSCLWATQSVSATWQPLKSAPVRFQTLFFHRYMFDLS